MWICRVSCSKFMSIFVCISVRQIQCNHYVTLYAQTSITTRIHTVIILVYIDIDTANCSVYKSLFTLSLHSASPPHSLSLKDTRIHLLI